ncbi:hypothetical protein ABIA27_003931 [Sinorhizobium fredii]
MFRIVATKRTGAVDEAKQREDGHEQGNGVEQEFVARKPVSAAHPEPGAETGVAPYEQQRDRLAGRARRTRPEPPQNLWIVGSDSGQERLHPGGDHVGYQQKGQAQAEDDLQRFAHRHAERLATIETIERHQEVEEQGAVEQDRAGYALPDKGEHAPAGLHRADRDQAKRVICEMREHEDGEHGPGNQVRLLARIGGNDRQTVCPGLPAAAGPLLDFPLSTSLPAATTYVFYTMCLAVGFAGQSPQSEEYPGVLTR